MKIVEAELKNMTEGAGSRGMFELSGSKENQPLSPTYDVTDVVKTSAFSS